MVDHSNLAPGEIPRRSNSIFVVLLGTCAILTIICACLISTIILIRQYQASEKKNKSDFAVISDSHYSGNFKFSNMAKGWEKDHRIPRETIPLYYDLLLNPDLESGKFSGSVVITFQVKESVEYLVVHVKNLDVFNTSLRKDNGSEIQFKNAFHHEENQFWVVELFERDKLQMGLYKISMEFRGNLTGKIVGFYRSIYNDEDSNSSRYIATTKFEPVDARQAFPCFDEPALKAKFTIRLVRPRDGYSALSNMDIVQEVPGPGPNEVTVHFAESKPMSTYLACFIVSDFLHSGEGMVQNGRDGPIKTTFPVRVFSTPANVENTLFAKKVAVQVSEYFVDYFGIPYPLPKLDLIAIPDFVSGAMENWGLITFRETALLYNETANAAFNKKRVALVVAHEIAHQWFGNLVTMKWWDDLWLNEGFASFMQFKGTVEGVEDTKDWEMWSQALYDDIQPVLQKDASIASHPIVRQVYHPSQITESFDSISYHKGMAVLRMLEAFIGVENFKNGIRRYLKNYEYSSASTDDLWNSLSEDESRRTGVNVTEIMKTWTLQMGYPIIHAKRENKALVLTQTSVHSGNPKDSPFGYKWDVPIHYVTSSDPKPKLIWLKRSSEFAKIPLDSNTDFVKLNHQQIGFYRVNYEKRDWEKFNSVLNNNHELLDKIDRAQLLDDAFSLASSNQLDYDLVLNMINYVKNETEYLPQVTGFRHLKEVLGLMLKGVHYTSMRKFIRSLISHKYGKGENQYSWDVNPNDSHITRLLRNGILAIACKSGVEECLKDANEIFIKWIKSEKTVIHPDLRPLIYYTGMYSVGGEKEWDIVWERYKKENNAQRKVMLLQALCYVKEPWLLSRFLEYAKDERNVRSQDFFFVVNHIAANPVGSPIVWNFFRSEWLYLINRFTITYRQLGVTFSSIASSFSTQLQLEEIEAFCKKYPEAGATEGARKSSIEAVKRNIAWRERNEKIIGDWLEKKGFASQS